jgi:aromatase
VDTALDGRFPTAPEVVFRLAASVEQWPLLLPHYRWVRVLETRGTERVVDMAARRVVLGRIGIPLHWTSIQRMDQERLQIDFHHIGGITRGMSVRWSIREDASQPGWTLATIRHVFTPRWPVPDRLLQLVVGDYFVNGVARRTLAGLSDVAAQQTLVASRV